MNKIFGFAKLIKRIVQNRQHKKRPAYAIILESTYDIDVNELWDILTNKDRLPFWFSPVNGALCLGGDYQIEGNASGSITRCDQLEGFEITWEFGGNISWVKVELREVTKSQTTLLLEHLSFAEGEHWESYGPGALGVGWECGLLGLANYIKTKLSVDQDKFYACSEYREFVSYSSKSWGEAAIGAGYDQDKSTAAAQKTEKFYLGEE